MGTQQLILYVVAVLIAGTVLFLLATVQQRSQEASIDAVQYRAAKQGMLDLVQMIEQDFQNVGSYMYCMEGYCDEGNERFVAETMDLEDVIRPPSQGPPLQGRDSTAVDDGYHHWFVFRAQVDPAEPPVEVRYEWMPSERSVTLSDGTERQLYTVERYVDDELSGSSTNMVTSMTVDLRPEELGGPPITFNPEDTRQINVEIRAVSPLGRGDLIEETLFKSSYRPVAMSI